MANVLFEVTVLNGNTPVTLRMASASATVAGTQLNGYQWTPLVTKRHGITGGWANDGIFDEGSVNHSSLSFRMSSAYENEAWSSYEWTGGLARIFVQEGDEGNFSQYRQTFEGSVSSLDRDGINATIGLLGPDALLDRNLLSLEYQGTGGAEGRPALKGTLKKRAFGNCQSVDPTLVDAASWIYQVHGYGAVASIKPYEYAQALDPAKNKGDQADFAALKALALVPGEWATCLALGMFRLGATPQKKVSADVQPVGATTVETVLTQLLTLAGIPAAKQGNSSAFSGVSWSLYVSDQATIGEVARRLVYEAGGVLFADGTGKWQVMNYFASSTAIVLNADRSSAPLVKSIKEFPAASPVWKVRVGYDRCWSVHASSDVSPALSDASDVAQAAKAAAQTALEAAQLAAASSTAAKARLDAMSDDGKLDRAEKATIVKDFGVEAAQQSGLQGQSTNVDVSAERASLANAFASLKTYLEGLNPAYTDSTQDTPIDRTVFDARWKAYWLAKQTLMNKLAGLGSTTATWGGVTGNGRPADNADVTGNNTAKDTLAVGGVPAAELIGRINAIIRDNVISREEKPGLLRDYNSLTGTSGEINILAERARVRGLDSGAMGSAKYNLDVALNALSSPTAWNDLSGDTNFNSTTTREIFQQRWLELDRAIIAMRAALDADAKAAETEAFKRVEQAASDGWLTPKEKMDAEADYNNMVDRLNELVTRCGAMGDPANVLTARNEAGNAIYRGYGTSNLGDYLYPIISNRTGNTAIDPAVFVARWRDATRKLTLFESLLIGSVNLDTQAAIAAINDLDSDGIWTTIEKSKVLIPEINRLNNEYAVLVGKAQSIPNTAVGYSSLVGPLNTAVSARKNWEDNRPAAWNNTSVDTTINRPYMRALIEGYGNALQSLGDALRTYLDVKAQTALDRVGSIVNDGIINGFEKWALVQDWQVINKRYNALNVRYAALGYPSDVTPSFNTAVQQLDLLGKYLGDLRPAWNDSNADTPVNMTDFNGYWVGALSAMDSYHATITGRPGPKGDTGATGAAGSGSGSTTRSPSTLTFSTGVQSAGWHSPTIVVNMTPGMSIPVEMYMSGYSGYSSASNVAIYIQAFRSSDGSLLTNFGPTSIYAPATTPSGQPVNDSPGSGYVRGTFTNNTGVTQNIGFWAHVSSGNIQNDGNSYLRV